jgi:hypothetical protein
MKFTLSLLLSFLVLFNLSASEIVEIIDGNQSKTFSSDSGIIVPLETELRASSQVKLPLIGNNMEQLSSNLLHIKLKDTQSADKEALAKELTWEFKALHGRINFGEIKISLQYNPSENGNAIKNLIIQYKSDLQKLGESEFKGFKIVQSSTSHENGLELTIRAGFAVKRPGGSPRLIEVDLLLKGLGGEIEHALLGDDEKYAPTTVKTELLIDDLKGFAPEV